MAEFVFLFSIVSLLLSAAAQLTTWVLFRKTKAERVLFFLLSNFLTFLILSVLTWDLYCSILGRDTTFRNYIWPLIDFCVCALCAALPRATRPRIVSRRSRAAEKGTAAVAAVLAVLRAALLFRAPDFSGVLWLYIAIYGSFGLVLAHFGLSVRAHRKDFLSDAALRHYQRALDVTGVSLLLLLPALVVVDFAGWLIPAFSRLVPRGFSVLPLFLDIMSVSIAAAAVLDVLEPVPVAGVDAVDDLFVRKYALSPREAELVPLVLRNLSYREIGDRLFISPGTVRTHIIHIYRKTNVATRLELSRLVWSEHRGDSRQTLQK